eukprot:SAG11_NODE_864_length_6839_cov_4.807567_1_plen_195_part_00
MLCSTGSMFSPELKDGGRGRRNKVFSLRCVNRLMTHQQPVTFSRAAGLNLALRSSSTASNRCIAPIEASRCRANCASALPPPTWKNARRKRRLSSQWVGIRSTSAAHVVTIVAASVIPGKSTSQDSTGAKNSTAPMVPTSAPTSTFIIASSPKTPIDNYASLSCTTTAESASPINQRKKIILSRKIKIFLRNYY